MSKHGYDPRCARYHPARARYVRLQRYGRAVPRIYAKGQVILPADVREAAGFSIGDTVTVRSLGPGRIEVIKTSALVSTLAGSLDEDSYPDDYLETVNS